MKQRAEAGLPGPGHKLAATGLNPRPCMKDTRGSALFTYLYIKRSAPILRWIPLLAVSGYESAKFVL